MSKNTLTPMPLLITMGRALSTMTHDEGTAGSECHVHVSNFRVIAREFYSRIECEDLGNPHSKDDRKANPGQ